MFAMVLAIGLLVDDAIVVVENVERVMEEENISPKEATRKSMKQITGALVGIALVLSAVFLPMAFFGGSTGVIYRQFSITMVVGHDAVGAGGIDIHARTVRHHPAAEKALARTQGSVRLVQPQLRAHQRRYQHAVTRMLSKTGRYLIVFGLIVVLMAVLFVQIPRSFLPDEDQGILLAQVSSPPGATNERTQRSLDQVRDYFLTEEKDSVLGVFTISGFNFAARGQANGFCFVRMKDWKDRPGRAQSRPGRSRRAPAGRSRRLPTRRPSPLLRPPCSNSAMPRVSTWNCSIAPIWATTS